MTQKNFNTPMTAACFIGLVTVASAVHAAPNATSICVRNALAQYNDSKAVSLVCHDQLEADVDEGIETGMPLNPGTIQARSEQCLSFEMTPEQRKAAISACQEIKQPQGNAKPPDDKHKQAASYDLPGDKSAT